jgi:undecaprenyl-diphosphatase
VTLWHGLLLGSLQGATEFLPISSSGHLVLARAAIDLPQGSLLFDVLLHVATLFVVCFVFRSRLVALLGAAADLLLRPARPDPARAPERRLLLLLLIATAVTGVVALSVNALEPPRQARWTGAMMLVTAVVLVVGRRLSTRQEKRARSGQPGWRWATGVGFAQGIAVLPGLSRSGLTIAVATAGGAAREAAAEFSFLASIPAIVGAFIITAGDAAALGSEIDLGVVVAATGAAVVTGYVALRLLLQLVRGGRLHLFAYYLVPVGTIALLLS